MTHGVTIERDHYYREQKLFDDFRTGRGGTCRSLEEEVFMAVEESLSDTSVGPCWDLERFGLFFLSQ